MGRQERRILFVRWVPPAACAARVPSAPSRSALAEGSRRAWPGPGRLPRPRQRVSEGPPPS
eukprot:7877645-Pyramimonas_sp.AAC.1